MKGRNLFGYFLGLALFIFLIPWIMYMVSRPVRLQPAAVIIFLFLSASGIGLSVWSIVYMKRVGKGNPMDAFNHEIAPRTSELMTSGPYSICRNPMLLGVIVYYIGVLICLHSWKAVVIFAAYIIIMMIQVGREEKRLEQDFGDAYREYCRNTKKLIPFIW